MKYFDRDGKIYCTSISDIPNEDHFAIITRGTYYTPADQRSIDYPGHGYPASSEEYVMYTAYKDEEFWKHAITELSLQKYGNKEFKAIVVKVPKVTTEIKVVIK
jgi:hypothetical protein